MLVALRLPAPPFNQEGRRNPPLSSGTTLYAVQGLRSIARVTSRMRGRAALTGSSFHALVDLTRQFHDVGDSHANTSWRQRWPLICAFGLLGHKNSARHGTLYQC